MTNNKADEEDGDEQEVVLPHHSQLFAPKSLVLITRHDCFETFRVGHLELKGYHHAAPVEIIVVLLSNIQAIMSAILQGN